MSAQKPSSVRRRGAKPVQGVRADLLLVVHHLERFATQTVAALAVIGLMAAAALVLSILAISR